MKDVKRDLIFVAVVFFAVGAFLSERRLTYPANVFPYAVISIVIVCALIILIKSLTLTARTKQQLRVQATDGDIEDQKPRGNTNNLPLIIVSSILYIAFIKLIGFYISSFIFLFILTFFLQDKSLSPRTRSIRSVTVAPIVVALVYILFDLFLNVPVPSGILV